MSFIEEYFIQPIMRNGWFNPVNTVVYSIALVIAVYLVYKHILVPLKIKVDGHSASALLPFIFWASSTRVLHDAAYAGVLTGPVGNFYNLPIFPTPGSYFITFTLALAVLLISLSVQKYTNHEYWKVMLAIGTILCLINIALLPVRTLAPLAYLLPIFLFWVAAFTGIMLFARKKFHFWNKEHVFIILSHMLDATATFVAIAFFGYAEQHVVPRFLISLYGPWVMFPLKLLVVIPILYLIDKEMPPGDFKNFIKIVILILGLAPGLRDSIRLFVLA